MISNNRVINFRIGMPNEFYCSFEYMSNGEIVAIPWGSRQSSNSITNQQVNTITSVSIELQLLIILLT